MLCWELLQPLPQQLGLQQLLGQLVVQLQAGEYPS